MKTVVFRNPSNVRIFLPESKRDGWVVNDTGHLHEGSTSDGLCTYLHVFVSGLAVCLHVQQTD